jgi:hypothetical protein
MKFDFQIAPFLLAQSSSPGRPDRIHTQISQHPQSPPASLQRACPLEFLSAVEFRRLDQYLQVGGLVVQQRLEPVADAIVERPGCVAINPMNLAQSNGDPPPNATMPSQP